jgi:hypothetical protein
MLLCQGRIERFGGSQTIFKDYKPQIKMKQQNKNNCSTKIPVIYLMTQSDIQCIGSR